MLRLSEPRVQSPGIGTPDGHARREVRSKPGSNR